MVLALDYPSAVRRPRHLAGSSTHFALKAETSAPNVYEGVNKPIAPRVLEVPIAPPPYKTPPPQLPHKWTRANEAWPIYLTPVGAPRADGPITIYIHGAGYPTFSEANRLADKLSALKGDQGEAYLLHWPSSSIAGSAMTAYLGSMLRGGNARADATKAGLDTAKQQSEWAERVAKMIGTTLDAANPDKKRSLRLVGHSLGAHLILSALQTAKIDGHTIDEVVFMGGCTSAKIDPAALERAGVKRLLNFYSAADKMLAIAGSVWGARAGSAPLELESACSTEVISLGTKLDHDHYWDALVEIDDQARQARKPAKS